MDDPNTPEDESANAHSASQQSYTQLVEHFDNLITTLDGEPLYKPNETDLTVVSLQAQSVDMKAANTGVINNYTNITGTRASRDTELYAPETGLVDLALAVKKYVKAAFGTDSSQYNSISGLEFKRITP